VQSQTEWVTRLPKRHGVVTKKGRQAKGQFLVVFSPVEKKKNNKNTSVTKKRQRGGETEKWQKRGGMGKAVGSWQSCTEDEQKAKEMGKALEHSCPDGGKKESTNGGG